MEKRGLQEGYSGRVVSNLAQTLEALGRLQEAEAWQRKSLGIAKERSGAESEFCAAELAALAHNLLKQEKWTDSEAALRESLAIREKKQPDNWTTFSARSLFGAALAGQKKFAEAEPLLLSAHEGLKQRSEKIPAPRRKPRLIESLQRLVQLYEATNKADEAAKWRKEWESLKPAEKP